MIKKGIRVILLLCLSVNLSVAAVRYELSMPNPNNHLFHVTIHIDQWKSAKTTIEMPVWAPGSYLVREFARHVEDISATDENGKLIQMVKNTKNQWQINSKSLGKFSIKYKVYAYELSVRTSYLDAEHGYINGTSVFMRVLEAPPAPLTLNILPHSSFSKVAVALPQVADKKFTYTATDYDLLADSPIEIGNHAVYNFTAQNIPHTIALFGNAKIDEKKLTTDLSKIIDEATKVFGAHPCQQYLFIVHSLTENAGGGLEHLNSTTCQVTERSWETEEGYRGNMGLFAHEYFHLWNVKRLRPVPLGPFDYNNENYTTMLWFSEGFTAYYDNLLVRRAGFMPEKNYVNLLVNDCQAVQNAAGAARQSVSDASFDAWIKFYRPNENTPNTTISYYTKGGVIGALLDAELLAATNAEKGLDEAMRSMYQKYYVKQKRAFTPEEFYQEIALIGGSSLSEQLKTWVTTTQPIQYATTFDKMGITLLSPKPEKPESYLGCSIAQNGNVTTVLRDSPAEKAGIYVNDYILGIDDWYTKDLNAYVRNQPVGNTVKIAIVRAGKIKNLTAILESSPSVKFSWKPKEQATAGNKKCYQRWIAVENK